MKSRTKFYVLIIIVLLVGIGIGYARWDEENLTIFSDVNLIGSKWDVKISNVSEKKEISNIEIEKASNTLTKTKLSFVYKIDRSNDVYIPVTFDIVNNGKKNAVLSRVDVTIGDKHGAITSEGKDFDDIEGGPLSIKIEYADGAPVETDTLFAKQTTDTMKAVMICVLDNPELDYDALDKDVQVVVELTFTAADSNATERLKYLGGNAETGDYVQYNPFENIDNKNITISSLISGYEENQTFNLEELNLWQVLNFNNNENYVELASVYVSDYSLKLRGETGYKNEGTIFKQIEDAYLLNNKIKSARLFGHINQTDTIEEIAVSPITEPEGAGDAAFLVDVNLLNTTLNSVKATKHDGDQASYFATSRVYQSGNLLLKSINSTGNLEELLLKDNNNEYTIESGIRMIIRIPYYIFVSGNGEKNTPYVVR